MAKLKIGIVGCGGIANQKHLPAMRANEDLCQVVAFCDVIRERAEKAAGEYGIPGAQVCGDYKELLANPEVEVVHVLTPNVSHSEITIAAFEAIGANPIVIPSGEAYTAVQTGVADGLEGHAEYMVLQKFYEVAKNYVQTQHVMTFTALNMSEQVYQSLTDSQKAAFDEAAAEALEYFYDYTNDLFDKMYTELENQGVTITDLDRTPFEEACAPFIQNFVDENGLQEVYDAIQAAAE